MREAMAEKNFFGVYPYLVSPIDFRGRVKRVKEDVLRALLRVLH